MKLLLEEIDVLLKSTTGGTSTSGVAAAEVVVGMATAEVVAGLAATMEGLAATVAGVRILTGVDVYIFLLFFFGGGSSHSSLSSL